MEALVGAGYEVQALTRSSIVANTIPLAVKLVEVDYGNLAALRTILEGQDVVISTLGDTAGAVAAQEVLILAAIAAGVRRFVPSEFGSDTENERVRSMPFFADKLKHRELLENAAAINPHFTYSIFVTGPFLDWGLSVVPFIINVGLRSADGMVHQSHDLSSDSNANPLQFSTATMSLSVSHVWPP